jgi:prepilin-type N-terminal cleavage/methylation domain-containing protein
MKQQTLVQKKSNAGFTLVELMVSLAIMVIILAVVSVNYRKFDSGMTLTNLAYDVGLSIRKAQTYGLSVRGVAVNSTQSFQYPYGIHFDNSSPKSYFIFADMNDNQVYDSGTDTKVDSYTIKGPFSITSLCVLDSSDNPTCGGYSNFDISFERPNPDATMCRYNVITSKQCNPVGVLIKVSSTQDTASVKHIIVRPTGQISVKNP